MYATNVHHNMLYRMVIIISICKSTLANWLGVVRMEDHTTCLDSSFVVTSSAEAMFIKLKGC